jgi:uncharacterized protein (DUF2235 family)
MDKVKFILSGGRLNMTKSTVTFSTRLLRAMIEVVESTKATNQERIDAAAMILKAKELASKRDRTSRRKQPKQASPSFAVLGTR